MKIDRNEVVRLLERLSNAKGPSGFEDEVIDVVRDFCDGWATVEENTLRDGLIVPNGTGLDGDRARPRVMMDAHGDEVGGMEDARRLIEAVVPIADAPRVHDYKTEYQELAQSVTGETPVYRIVGEEGPAHMRTFFAEVELCGAVTGRGEGSSKKHAEQQAARDALSRQGL